MPSTPQGPMDEPARSDIFVRGLSEAIGGPLGDHAVRSPDSYRRVWTATRIILALTCLMLAFHWVQKSPCRDGAWTNLSQYKYFCYTDVLALYYAEKLSDGAVPYIDHPVEYPVLTGALIGVIGLPIHKHGTTHSAFNQGQVFYDINAFVLAAFAIATVATILAVRRRRPWDAAMFAVAPALFVTATVNWDLLAVGLTGLGMYTWARKKPALAGVLLGLAIAAKFYPLLLFGPLLLLAARTGRWPSAITSICTAAITWILINIPVMFVWPDSWSNALGRISVVQIGISFFVVACGIALLLSLKRENLWKNAYASVGLLLGVIGITYVFLATLDIRNNWLTFFHFNSERGIDWGTIWYIGEHFPTGGGEYGISWFSELDSNPTHSGLNALYLTLFLAACIGIAVLTFLAPRRPRFGQLAFLVVAAFLLVGKVWSQQYVLWLLPLAILARPRWGAFLAWQAAEIGYFLAFYGELMKASNHEVFPEWVFILASMMRLITLAVLIGFVVRDVIHPHSDIVRQNYSDDPDGGVFDNAPDIPLISTMRLSVGMASPPEALEVSESYRVSLSKVASSPPVSL